MGKNDPRDDIIGIMYGGAIYEYDEKSVQVCF